MSEEITCIKCSKLQLPNKYGYCRFCHEPLAKNEITLNKELKPKLNDAFEYIKFRDESAFKIREFKYNDVQIIFGNKPVKTIIIATFLHILVSPHLRQLHRDLKFKNFP